jgi:acyl transferase domain-containing protein/acetylornithine/succinyldiaminopimelate/putrescine aminotransferase
MSDTKDFIDAIALIGMAGRFPGAKNIAQYWENLCKDVESVCSFTREELIAEGCDSALVNHPDYVPRRGIIQGSELFDAEFFGFSPREATVTDPQQRLFMECVWEALESAGYTPDACRVPIGVYAGTGFTEYLFHLYSDQELFRRSDAFHMLFGNDKDYLATRTAYKLNLRGPSVNINTACSTSLVAVSMACQALRNGECDMALAGGVRLNFPQKGGYLYQEGSIMSPDGHCRAFDAKAQGTVGGNGVGVVVLKRLEDALEDGDEVMAVIKGFAINNDGGQKVGFTAPSVEGQAAVISEALANAGVSPETVTYVEAHGTGTQLGDPIEVAALTRAFRLGTEKKQYCGLGSVKSNVGHLDAAAGVAGLIKAALAVKHGKIPASLHYQEGNREIGFAESPFYVNAKLQEWKPEGGVRRAGVSSFGIGGTNAHLVLEEAPEGWKSSGGREKQLLVISGRNEAAVEEGARNLREYLEGRGDECGREELADAAYTLAVGRKGFGHRMAVVSGSVAEAVERLKEERRKEEEGRGHIQRGEWKGGRRRVAVLFSGQGSQYVQMGRELYGKEGVFREEIDWRSQWLKGEIGLDLREVMYAEGEEEERKARELLRQTWVTQPALYVLERALLKQWESWGVEVGMMLGHSLGEIVGACAAGVMSEEEGLRLVAARGRLMWKTERGGMLSALLGEAEGRRYERKGVEIGAVNGREQVVFTGGEEELGVLEEELKKAGVVVKRLEVERAFHSERMEGVKEEYLQVVKGLRLKKPEKRYISNVTGSWAGEEVREAEYWWEQMRRPVRFAAGVEELVKSGERVWLEVGPGESLARLVGQEMRRQGEKGTVVASLGGEGKKGQEQEQMMRGLGKLWAEGVGVDWKRYYGQQRRRRVPLPTYPFQRQRYVIPTGSREKAAVETKPVAAPAPSDPRPPQTSPLKKEANMQTVQKVKQTRQELIIEKLCTAWASLLGIKPEVINPHATFFELGVDSLLLIQVSKLILNEFQIKLPFRKLLEEFTTIHSLAVYLDQKLPAGQFEPQVEVEETIPVVAAIVAAEPVIAQPEPAAGLAHGNGSSVPLLPTPDSDVSVIIAQQLQIMSRQLEVLQGKRTNGLHTAPISATPSQADLNNASTNGRTAEAPKALSTPATAAPTAAMAGQKPEPFVPYQPIRPHLAGEFTEQQQKYLHEFTALYNKRSAKSKEHFEKHHTSFADNRALQGFRLSWKEMVYPIVGRRSEAARIWDVDGNSYIDMTMGFGVHLFGHSPAFVTKALEKQIHHGLQLGPQSELAGKVASSISQMTGMQRVTFCNSGTEAVMAALRLARVATGRDKVIMFAGSYHGTFDGNLARIQRDGNGELKTVPAGPGIPQNMVSDVTALYYNEPESLDFIKRHGHEYAAVLVEPVQSRRPDIQPREFLHELRRLTEKSGTALIFDDIINGFRVHPGGTQAWFDVKADIATYGKVVAGGMPIGIVAGSDTFLDGIDGGSWSFGDRSYPEADQIIFAGTFCKHPLSMAACDAVLQHLQQGGPGLQQELNRRSARFVESLNALLEKHQVPMRVVHFGSLIRFLLLENTNYMDLFFYHLIHNGVFVWEGRTAFVSTAHTEEDLQLVLQGFEKTILQMREGGFFNEVPLREPEAAIALPKKNHETDIRVVAATEQQRQLWALAQLGPESSCAYNESIVLTVRGPLQADAVRKAVGRVVQRHESLRTVFSADGEFQRILPAFDIAVPLLDFSHDPFAELKKSEALQNEASTVFDLLNGPLLRLLLIKLAENSYVLSIVAHHSIMDGWSGSTFLRDLSAFYEAELDGKTLELDKPMQFANYIEWQGRQDDLPSIEESRMYWLGRFADGVPRLQLPTEGARPPLYTHAGGQQRLTFDPVVYEQVRSFNKQHGFTMFNVLISAYTALLAHLSGQKDVVVGMHSAGHSLVDGRDLVGHCINLLPLRSECDSGQSFLEHATSCRREVFSACEYQLYPYSKLAKDLNLPRDPSRLTLVEVVFNLDQTVSSAQLFGFEVEVDAIPSGYTKWDLSWNVVDTGKDMAVRCDYNRDLFSAEKVERWLAYYELILNAVTTQPNKKLSALMEEVELRLRRKDDQRIRSLKAANQERLKNLKKRNAAVAVTV